MSDVITIDERLIEQRTESLPRVTRAFSRDFRLAGRTEVKNAARGFSLHSLRRSSAPI